MAASGTKLQLQNKKAFFMTFIQKCKWMACEGDLGKPAVLMMNLVSRARSSGKGDLLWLWYSCSRRESSRG